MKKFIAAAATAILLSFSLAGCATVTSQPTTDHVQSQTVNQCEEDQPCWDCETMGNKICGTQSVDTVAAESHEGGVGGAACADWEALMNQHNVENPDDQWNAEWDINKICAGQNH